MCEGTRARSYARFDWMRGKEALEDGRRTVEINLVLEKEVYELIERISTKLGMEPSSWINLVLSSKVKIESPEKQKGVQRSTEEGDSEANFRRWRL